MADHTKFGRRALVRLCEFSEITHLVSDQALDDEWRERLGAMDVDLLIDETNGVTTETER